jgi:anti-anti-sigma factor
MAAVLTVTSRRADDGTVAVAAVGELDMSTIGRFESALRTAIDEAGPGRTTTLDLSAVEYLDSAAINVLFENAERIGSVLVHPLLLRGLTISGLDQVVEVRSAALD